MDLTTAAEYMGMSPEALLHKVRDGVIPTVKLDRRTRFDRKDLDHLIESSKERERRG